MPLFRKINAQQTNAGIGCAIATGNSTNANAVIVTRCNRSGHVRAVPTFIGLNLSTYGILTSTKLYP